MSSFVKSHSIYLNFQWDDDEVHFVLDQRALEFDLIVLFVGFRGGDLNVKVFDVRLTDAKRSLDLWTVC
jgi:hypothetical protein